MSKIKVSQIEPTEFKVLLKPVKVEEKTAGGIFIPEMAQDAKKYAETQGEILAISHLAFSYADEEEWDGKKPKVGDIALYAKYAGTHIKCEGDEEFLIVNDKDIVATLRNET